MLEKISAKWGKFGKLGIYILASTFNFFSNRRMTLTHKKVELRAFFANKTTHSVV